MVAGATTTAVLAELLPLSGQKLTFVSGEWASCLGQRSVLGCRGNVRRRTLKCLLGTVGGGLGGAVLGLQAGAGLTEVLLPGSSTLVRALVAIALAVVGALGGAASGAVIACFRGRS
jgi:hypothetical protein